MSIITVQRKVLDRNDLIAEENRVFFKQHQVFVINLLSSPGSGKTTLLERTIARLRDKTSIAVVEGDVQTDLDAQRIEALGIPVTQIITNGGCHLEAKLVKEAMQTLTLDDAQLVVIENVGNLVCPAGYDLGENAKVVILSVTEGEDKPLKYPAMFRNATVCVINKIDLLPYVRCSLEALKKNALAINPQLQIFLTSCTTDEGLDEWCDWLLSNIGKSG
jgi:hydrogenase nickel incorporation protein HypB